MRSASALALSLAAASLGGCAGESFGVGEAEPAGQGGGAFPPLDTTTSGLSGSGGSSAGSSGEASGGTGGGGGEAGGGGGDAGAGGGAPTSSACGELRGAAGEDVLEVCIEAGSFTMGDSAANVPSGYTAHGPAHQVTLSAGYVLDAYEVTVARYRACVTAEACAEPLTNVGQGCTYTTEPGAREQHPVTCVRWDDAIAFCDWDGGRRLPTEAEWERAARGTGSTRFAWGDDVSCSKAVFGGNAQQQCPNHVGQTPKPVGSTPLGASAEGAFDLTGNAWEWVNDWFGPYASGEVTDPTGPNTGSVRVLRGGNWQTATANSAAFMRRAEAPASTGPTSFRCARDIDTP